MRKTRLKTVVLVLVSAVGSLLAGVAVAGYLTVPRIPLLSEGDDLVVFDAEIGAVAKPNSHARRIYPAVRDRQTFAFDIYTNDRGARVDGPGQVSPMGVGILTVGDSFTWGYALANEDTYASRLSHELDASVANFAMAAYGTTQSLQLLRRNRDLAPKLVIYGIIAHHLERNVSPCAPSYYPFCFDVSHVTWDGEGRPWIAPPASNGVRRFQRHLQGDFADPVGWLMHGLDVIQGRLELARASYREPDDAKKEQALSFLLCEMERSVAEMGARLLVVYLPTNYYSAPEALQRAAGNVMLLDLTEAFRRTRDSGGPSLYIVGDGHPNAAAHALISKEIAKHVRRHGLL